MPVVIGVAIILVAVILINNVQVILRKQYTTSAAALAKELGLHFSPDIQPAAPSVTGDLLLLAQGIPHSRQNVMEGICQDVDISVYTYTFKVDLGKLQELFSQTVVQIKSLHTTLPQFTLCPQDQVDAIVQNLSSKQSKDMLLETAGIRLGGYPVFRNKYKLIGTEWQTLAAMFDRDAVVKALEKMDTDPVKGLVCMEGAGQNLLIYPLYKRLPVKQIKDFVDKCISLSKQLDANMSS